MRCVIADDEPIARQILERYIQEVSTLELVGMCKNAFEVIELLQRESVDLLFLDINMPKLNGISLLKTLKHPPNVVITTAYPEYALDGFELDVRDYLLKPFSLERFLQAVFKVQKSMQTTTVIPTNVAANITNKQEDYLFVKSDKKIIKLYLADVQYIEAYGNYIKIHADEMILVGQSLSDFASKLSDQFIRIHKSYIINFDQLKLVDGNQLLLSGRAKLPIGKSYRKALLALLAK